MRKVYGVLGWGNHRIGPAPHGVHTSRPDASAVWFFSGGMAIVLTGALNLLSRTYGGSAVGAKR